MLSIKSLLCVEDASNSGVAQETIRNTVRRASKVMTEQEARQILGVTEEMPWEEIVKVNSLMLFTNIVHYTSHTTLRLMRHLFE